MLIVVFGVVIAVAVEVGPNNLVSIASSLPPSQVTATVPVAVVGVGLTILLSVDILPWLFGPLGLLILLVVPTRQLDEIVGVIMQVILSIIVYVEGLVTLGIMGSFSLVCLCLGCVLLGVSSLAS